jgi:hypothetical protein
MSLIRAVTHFNRRNNNPIELSFGEVMELTDEQRNPGQRSEEDRYEEEFAAEVNPATPIIGRPLISPEEDRPDFGNREFRSIQAEENERTDAPATLGWISLIVALVSLFVWPYVLGPVAAVMGFVSYFQGSRALGIWSLIIGVVSILSYWVLVPYYA